MSDSEKRAYCSFLNGELRGDPELKPILPINLNSDDFYKEIGKGILLSKFIAKRFPKVPVGPSNESVIAAAKEIGISLNIETSELEDAVENPELVLEFVWQLIKCYICDIQPHDDLKRLLENDSEDLRVLCSQPEKLLIRWVNFHLKNHGHHRTINNFSSSINDAENYAVLISEIAKDTVAEEELVEAFKQKDHLKRAEMVLRWASRIGCRKFVSPEDIVNGTSNLNLGFVATLFKRYPALGPTSDEMVSELEFKIEEADNLLAESILDKEDLTSLIEQTKFDFESLTLELGELEVEFETLSAETELLEEEKVDLESLLNSVNEENDILSSEINDVTKEKDDLFAQLEAEVSMKLDLETLLKETEEEFANTKETTESKISDLQKQLEDEIALKNEVSSKLENTLQELDTAKLSAKELEESLDIKLKTHVSEREDVEKQLEEAKKELANTLVLADEAEQTKDDLFKLLTDTIAELETAKSNAQQTEEQLRNTLAEEIEKKEAAHKALQDKIEEYETALANWKVERAGLLKRIEELEAELAELKAEMIAKLEQALKEKADALAAALAEQERALSAAENEKDLALDKVRLLLTGNARQGILWRYESTLIGKEWKKKYFVLRDNLLSWYSSEKKTEGQKPKGVIYCEEARVYELPPEEIPGNKEYAFLVDTGKAKVHIAAESHEDMKSWMTEIRVAKKRRN